MNPILLISIFLILPAIATTLGSSIVYFFKNNSLNPKVEKIFNGFAAGVMFAASVFGLIIPSMETPIEYMPPIVVTIIGILLGVGLLLLIDHIIPHIHGDNEEEGPKTEKVSRANKLFLAITIHNIPEGLSVGVALGVAFSLFTNQGGDIFTVMSQAMILSIGIAIQNVPEGAATVLPLKESTKSTHKAFGYGVLSGVIEPLAGLIGFFLAFYIEILMPWALAFAAGCMIYVTVEDLIPTAVKGEHSHYGVLSFVGGFVIMMVLDVLLG